MADSERAEAKPADFDEKQEEQVEDLRDQQEEGGDAIDDGRLDALFDEIGALIVKDSESLTTPDKCFAIMTLD